MEARSEFEAWLVAREPSLQRLALLLAGEPHDARDLVQKTLAKLYLAWDRLEDRHDVDAYARRVLVNEHRSSWRRTVRRRELITADVPERPVTDHQDDGLRAAVWVVGAQDPENDPAPAPTTTPTPSVAGPTTPPTAPPEPVDGPPRIGYALNGEIVLPDGGTVTLDEGPGMSEFTSIDDGFLVAGDDFFEASVSITRYDADGQTVESWTGSGLATGTDGAAAWTSFAPPESGQTDPTLIHLDEESQEVDQVKPGVAAVTGDEVVFNGGGGDPGAWVTDLSGAPRQIPVLRSATDAAGGLVVGQEGDTTVAVVDLDTGEELWRRAGMNALGMSPDGRYVHVMGAGLGIGVRILEARTGELVCTIPLTNFSGLPGLHNLVWEDATHLLGVLEGDIVRVGLDGAVSWPPSSD